LVGSAAAPSCRGACRGGDAERDAIAFRHRVLDGIRQIGKRGANACNEALDGGAAGRELRWQRMVLDVVVGKHFVGNSEVAVVVELKAGMRLAMRLLCSGDM
jgi:hypothetical protein